MESREERKQRVDKFCQLVDNHEGTLTVKDGGAYDEKNNLIYQFREMKNEKRNK